MSVGSSGGPKSLAVHAHARALVSVYDGGTEIRASSLPKMSSASRSPSASYSSASSSNVTRTASPPGVSTSNWRRLALRI